MLLGCLTTTGLSIPAFKPITSLSGALCPINTAHSPQMQTLLFSAAPCLASKFNLSKILFFFSCLVICIVNLCIVKVFHINASHCFSTEVGDKVLKWDIIHQTGPNIVSIYCLFSGLSRECFTKSPCFFRPTFEANCGERQCFPKLI